ncbi:cation transporter [Phycicoccus sp. HDW14]|uniref:cation transporter n=1 Tax=Phycicoccus sp. HDW14 TaxID=2714941 RepID=UPI00197B68DE|nr:cation transporter [Phycicoccus sp. HDW14]
MTDDHGDPAAGPLDVAHLRLVVLLVALLNLGYFGVELTLALVSGSVSLLADSADFLEDTAVNLLVVLALGWPLAQRAAMGKAMAAVLLAPAAVAGWQAVQRLGDPVAPRVVPLVLASLGAIAVNGTCAWLLARVHRHGGSLSRAAFLSARNDVLVGVAIIVMGGVTAATGSGWPDLVLGLAIVALAVIAAREVWEVSEEERLAARAIAGDVG